MYKLKFDQIQPIGNQQKKQKSYIESNQTNLLSRAQLINWVNQITKAHILKLQELSDGIKFCQIFCRIYPNSINLNKLKRDVKFTSDKQKNFRLLLNAINSLGLTVALNITDLSEGKVTSILEFLQWIHKQYQNFIKKGQKNQHNLSGFSQKRTFQLYSGSLFTRKNSKKIGEKRSKTNQDKKLGQRKTLAQALNAEQPFQPENFLYEQKKQNSNDQAPNAKIIKSSDRRYTEAKKPTSIKLTRKISINEPNSQLKERLKRKRQSEKKKLSIEEILQKTLSLNQSKIKKRLVLITYKGIQKNPQLQQQFLQILNGDKNHNEFNQEKNNQVQTEFRVQHLSKDIQSLSYNTSLNCQSDTIQFSMESEKKQQNIQQFQQEIPSNQNISRQNNLFGLKSKNKSQVIDERQKTVKKSCVKQNEHEKSSKFQINSQVIRQISAQKQKRQINGQVDPNQLIDSEKIQFNISVSQKSKIKKTERKLNINESSPVRQLIPTDEKKIKLQSRFNPHGIIINPFLSQNRKNSNGQNKEEQNKRNIFTDALILKREKKDNKTNQLALKEPEIYTQRQNLRF